MCAFHTIQTAVDALSGRDDVPDGVYLSACEAMKELHSITDLYLVKYDRFFAYEDGEDCNGDTRLGVMRDTSCQAILRKDREVCARHINLDWCLRHGKLPTDTSHLMARSHENGSGDLLMITSIKPYLKRARPE